MHSLCLAWHLKLCSASSIPKDVDNDESADPDYVPEETEAEEDSARMEETEEKPSNKDDEESGENSDSNEGKSDMRTANLFVEVERVQRSRSTS